MKWQLQIICFIFLLPSSLMCQYSNSLINEIDNRLTRGETTLSKVLGDTSYMSLHSLVSFRELIKKHAKAEKINMVSSIEPGIRITVKAKVQGNKGKPIPGALVYLYHTSAKGWYSDTAAHILMNEGDTRHARLFTYLKTNAAGEFELETIRPAGYPDSDLPAHIHIAIWKDGQVLNHIPGELLFEEDPRLTPERKQRAIRDGFLVEKNKGTAQKPVYGYNIVAPIP